ncbi:MAG TPA: tRNA uracil 4-sulfurtransferase ThiI [Terriglobia bacterium]|nr:tRNA uracil 4-sulfurtransferase ThiI [Terriglobia bacterium]
MKRVLILHYHEIWLKGGNKKYFLSRLRDAICQSVADLPVASLESISERLILTPADDAALPHIIERLRRVFGLAYIAPAREVPSPLEALGPAACEMMAEANPRNFAVRVKTADSAYPMNSMELERELGRRVLEHLRAREGSVRVKLQEPEVTCQVEIVPGGRALIYAHRVEGPGGLPAVTSGRLVALLSGGFDSSVAAYKMMRRGCHITFAHFFGNPSPARNPSSGVAEELVRTLTPYQFTSRLYRIPFDAIQRQIVAGVHDSYRVLLYRRMMARIAREIARAEHALGLVTGDSVSQVASQTLHNLMAIDQGIDLPIYRPLAGDDKAEILRLARQIGTYKISCEPFEDCCPRFMPRAPAIFARPQELDEAECRLDIDALVRLGLDGATCVEYKFERGEVTAREGSSRRIEDRRAGRKALEGQPAAHDAASK